jgi:6-pyruvoyltetrahydropterin/6-carboxytetrahydropterin synthase
MWTVSKEFHFDAAHSLPHLPPDHKCHHLHGHTYKVVVFCSGGLDPSLSWVVDYAEIKKAVAPLIEQLDHKNINDVLAIPTTAENLAFWFYVKLRGSLPVSRVDVHETTGTCCTYTPEQ